MAPYGLGRVSQQSPIQTHYFLGDALGSVRQLVAADNSLLLTRSYDPYGNLLTSMGEGASAYGFTGEWTDSTGLVFLRARYYAPGMGRFLTRDVWPTNPEYPFSFHDWVYVENNPINFQDPSGYYKTCVFAAPQDQQIYRTRGWWACEALVDAALQLLGDDPYNKPVSYELWDVIQQYIPEIEITYYSGKDIHGGWRDGKPILEIPSAGVPFAAPFQNGNLSSRDLVYVSMLAHEFIHITLQPLNQGTQWGEADAFAIQADILDELGGTDWEVNQIKSYMEPHVNFLWGIPYGIYAGGACVGLFTHPDIANNRLRVLRLLEARYAQK